MIFIFFPSPFEMFPLILWICSLNFNTSMCLHPLVFMDAASGIGFSLRACSLSTFQTTGFPSTLWDGLYLLRETLQQRTFRQVKIVRQDWALHSLAVPCSQLSFQQSFILLWVKPASKPWISGGQLQEARKGYMARNNLFLRGPS